MLVAKVQTKSGKIRYLSRDLLSKRNYLHGKHPFSEEDVVGWVDMDVPKYMNFYYGRLLKQG